MNTKDFIRLGVPLGEATRRATDFVAKFMLGGGDRTRLEADRWRFAIPTAGPIPDSVAIDSTPAGPPKVPSLAPVLGSQCAALA